MNSWIDMLLRDSNTMRVLDRQFSVLLHGMLSRVEVDQIAYARAGAIKRMLFGYPNMEFDTPSNSKRTNHLIKEYDDPRALAVAIIYCVHPQPILIRDLCYKCGLCSTYQRIVATYASDLMEMCKVKKNER